jgi:hypothetical protein
MKLTAEQRRAPRMLADAGPRGMTEAMLMAHGFAATLAAMVRAALATATPEKVRAGGARSK